MADYKKLERAVKLFQKVKELDTEIIAIEKYAMKIANDEIFVDFSMNIIKAKEGEEKKSVIDGDGSITLGISMEDMMRRYMMPSYFGPIENSTKADETFKYEANSKEALLIFGIILKSKVGKRDAIIKKIESLQ